MPPSPTTDGGKVLTVSPDDKPAKWNGVLTEPEKKSLNKLVLSGITKDVARRIVRGQREDGESLKRAVCSGVMLTYWFGSMDAIERFQRRMLKKASEAGVDAETQVYAASVGAQLAIAMVRTGEAMIEKAASMDGEGGPRKPQNATNIQVNANFGFPPVAQPLPSAGSGPQV